MDKFIAQRVMSGTQGEIWIDGKYMADNIRNARQTVVTIRVKLDDPDAVGREEVIIRDATFDKLTLMDWEAKKLTEDDYDFTFTDFEVPVTADA